MSLQPLSPRRDAAEVLQRTNPTISRRLLVVLCFPLVFILAVPFWLYTTSIERLPLPVERIGRLENETLPSIRTKILFTADAAAFPVPPAGKAVFPLRQKIQAMGEEATNGVDGINGQKRPSERAKRKWDLVYDVDPRSPPPLRMHLLVTDTANKSFPLEPYIMDTPTPTLPSGTLVVPIHPDQIGDRNLKQHYKIALVRSLIDLLPCTPQPVPLRALKYAPNVTLSFVLLNEDAGASYVRSWDIERALEDHFLPHFEPLRQMFNFTVESQVVYHAPLAFDPVKDGEGWTIGEDEMKVFVNSEQWSLDSGSTNNPVLRFLLFVPTQHRPMHLSTGDAFLLPQYGGVVILNPPDAGVYHLTLETLQPAFDIFTRHFFSLLALPLLPAHIHASRPGTQAARVQAITPWQIDTALRTRLEENAREAAQTLAGIVRLVHKIEEMKVGEGVREKVAGAVRRLEGLVAASRSNSPLLAFTLSRDAVVLASQAFFDPSMMGLLYFPDQHKFAVYTPLFGPVGVAVVVSVIKEVSAFAKRRRQR